MKTRKKVFEAVPDARTLGCLADGTRLEWVPTWEGVLQYAPVDLMEDRSPRLWHTFRSKNFGGRRVRIELKPQLQKLLGRRRKESRIKFNFSYKGKTVTIIRSHLTMLCVMGFAIVNRHHWVIDHINCNTLDDRPSNLQVITHRENSLRSELYRMTRKLSSAEKHRQSEERIAWMNKRRLQLMAIHPDADRNDIEFELALEMAEGRDGILLEMKSHYEK